MEKVKFYRSYRKDGSLEYEGYGTHIPQSPSMFHYGFGVSYYEDGKVHFVGIFERAGLIKGRIYYPNGNLKYEGLFNHKQAEGGRYYWPTYPTVGKYYTPAGQMIYEGRINVKRIGNASYPVVLWPDGTKGQ